MHADEAIHADKFGTLLEGGGYAYDPSEYHGPTLYYLALPSAWLRGEHRYVDIDEITLRVVPAVLGVALVAAHAAARGFLGTAGAAVAALLCAISPAMVFYSRYFIHEIPLVVWSFGALLAACSYLRAPRTASALLAGACAGLMLATKETAPLVLGCMLLAFFLARRVNPRGRGTCLPPTAGALRHALLALLLAALVAAGLFSSGLARPQGIVDAARAYGLYLARSGPASPHVHPWDYYLRLLLHFPSSGTPFWTEGLILVLALAGAAAGWVPHGVPGADSRALRFIAFDTLLLLVAYSAIPYKTPWCLLGFLQGMILLAGVGAVLLVRTFRGVALRVLVGLALGAAALQLGGQAFAASFRFAADPRNPYVYAHTGTDVFEIVARVEALARAQPAGSPLSVQVISGQNLWPLPFYLRALPQVAWWTGVSDSAANAPVIIITPEMEPALVRKLYDLPAPGERELYVSLFDRPVELRPGVELRGYASDRLMESFRQREAEPPVGKVTNPQP
jgi:uncharacterized protein (TIGR03663 family)